MGIISCPSCRRRLHMPDEGLEQSLQCPACHAVFEAISTAPSPLGTTGVGVGQEEALHRAEVQHPSADNAWRRQYVMEGTQPSLSLVLQKSREGGIRRTLALVGFVGGIGVGLSAFASYALDQNTSFGGSLGALVLALVLSPVLGIVLAAIGAGFGGWIEIAIRLAKRRSGESVLLTLVGEEDAGASAVASTYPWDVTDDVVTSSDCCDASSPPSEADRRNCTLRQNREGNWDLQR